MIFRDLGGLKVPDICLIDEEKPQKNLTQETCPNQGSNQGPLHDKRACYRLPHSGGRFEHIKQMTLERLPSRALEMRIKSIMQQLGRPKLRWIKQIREDMQARGVVWTTIMNEEFWEDRDV